jgi:hypothetical protein
MKKTPTLLVAIALASGVLTVASPAAAAPACLGTSHTKIIAAGAEPTTVVVGTTVPRELSVYGQVEDPCTASVSSEVLLEGSPLSDDMEQLDRIGNVATFRAEYGIDPHDLTNADAGRWQAEVTAHGTTDDHAAVSFHLLRASRLTVNAVPEPVDRGGTITVTGLLTRASWDTQTYRGMQRAQVTLEARRPQDSAYVPLQRVASDTRGRLSARLTARQDICFRFVYAGSGSTAPAASNGDCVEVS